MNKILSISIAAYNVEKVIEQCLNSFISSKYLNLMEIIVVDDGSKDNTVELVNKYVNKCPQSIKLISKVNGGHGSTINTALEKATGKYFKIVDGDDWVDTEALDSLIENLLELDVDLVINNYQEIYVDKVNDINIGDSYSYNTIYNFEEISIKNVLPMHSLTVKLANLKKVDEKISEKRFYVDSEYIFFTAIYAESIIFYKEYVYQYRLGQIGQSVNPNNLYNHVEDKMFVIEKLLNVYSSIDKRQYSKKNKKYLFNLINVFYKNMYSWFLIMPKIDKYKKLRAFDKKMIELYPEYIKNLNLGIYRLLPLNYYVVLKFARFLKPIQMKIKNIFK